MKEGEQPYDNGTRPQKKGVLAGDYLHQHPFVFVDGQPFATDADRDTRRASTASASQLGGTVPDHEMKTQSAMNFLTVGALVCVRNPVSASGRAVRGRPGAVGKTKET